MKHPLAFHAEGKKTKTQPSEIYQYDAYQTELH